MEKNRKPVLKTIYFTINGEIHQVKAYAVSTIAEAATTALKISGATEVDIEKFAVKGERDEFIDKHKELVGTFIDSATFRISEILSEGYIPSQFKNPNFDAIRNQASECINFVASKGFNFDQFKEHKQYVFEVVMKALYGDDVFTWINKQG